AFVRSVGSLCDFWIANEARSVLPDIAARPPVEGREGWYLLAVNGTPIAWTDPHGVALDWID
ncbi:MAG TPA: hypothetical protein VHG31_00960, partial [Stellaceae bacterium]|nr:hypothetical protein [Stellaceae bacterium]